MKGYGRDTWCFDSLAPGRFATGVMLVAQALYRRYTTPRGTLRGGPEESVYGLDIAEYIGAAGEDVAVAALPELMRGEALKDDRVSTDTAATVTAVTNDAGEIELLAEVDAVLVDSGETFTLTLSASAFGVTLVGVQA